jgi:hypothetical protein
MISLVFSILMKINECRKQEDKFCPVKANYMGDSWKAMFDQAINSNDWSSIMLKGRYFNILPIL